MKIIILLTASIVGILITIGILINGFKKEIQESRNREDLLLTEVKLLDYQINVLMNKESK